MLYFVLFCFVLFCLDFFFFFWAKKTFSCQRRLDRTIAVGFNVIGLFCFVCLFVCLFFVFISPGFLRCNIEVVLR